MAPKSSKSVLYKPSHVAYQVKGNEELNTMVQKYCPKGMSRVTRGQKVGFWVLFFFIVTQLLGFLI